MASSALASLFTHRVFLSFRAEDTRKTFVSHLHRALVKRGNVSFKDDREFETGDSISDETRKAMGTSSYAIVVISKSYASSSWCLDELRAIIELERERRLVVFPIYYGVDPSDVRNQNGDFALERYEGSAMAENIPKWREALTQVASITGRESRYWDDEAELIDKIIDDLGIKAYIHLDDIIGMDSHMKAVYSLLDLVGTEDEVGMIGIWGLGGVGKTTLARHVYQNFSRYFHTNVFLKDVKKIYQDHGSSGLKKKLLSDGLQLTISGPSMIPDATIESLRGQRVLLVADDVDKIEQFDIVAEVSKWFGPGSRIIITTRNKHLLDARGVHHVYKVECLEYPEALRLFCHSAFYKTQPPRNVTYERLSQRVLKLARGLPLVLTTLGSLLHGKDVSRWESELNQFERSGHFRRMVLGWDIDFDGLDDNNESFAGKTPSGFISTTSTNNLKCLVGMDRQMRAMYKLLDLESSREVRIIGIWGPGGIGKSTLARYVYEETSYCFHTHVFLENADKYHQKNYGTRNAKMGSNAIQSRIQHRKRLLIVDGIEEMAQLEVIRKDSQWFGPGSRIIVTTRDYSLFEASGITHVYEVECLRYDEALQLFCQSAFEQRYVPFRFERLSVRAVELAGCLPLALKVLGSLLRGKREKDLEEEFYKLERKLQDEDVMEISKMIHRGAYEKD